jgi:hypothetical protein
MPFHEPHALSTNATTTNPTPRWAILLHLRAVIY